MNPFGVFISVFCCMSFLVKAQHTPTAQMDTSQDFVSSFRPSLALVMGIFCIMFSLTFLLVVYAKFCRTAASVHADQNLGQRSMSALSGVDKTVIESLPFFRFSSLRGSKEGLECAVCLSKFEDIEILRLLPKCKHAFHIACVDQWLENHSSCPLCRRKVSAEDLSASTYSSSLRFLWNPSELQEDPNLDLYVQREEDHQYGSSRFSIGSSLRKSKRAMKDEELRIQVDGSDGGDDGKNFFHRFNHKIIVSDVVYKSRWSNVSASDLMFLNSEMIGAVSSNRLFFMDTADGEHASRIEIDDDQVLKIKEEMERKRLFETKIRGVSAGDSVSFPGMTSSSGLEANSTHKVDYSISAEKRSKSEITALSRFREDNKFGRSLFLGNDKKEERMRKVWMPIARRTVQWFASRERWSQRYHNTRQSNV